LGAPAIAEETGCAQALINNIERGEGAKGSKFNDAFAKLFRVDANWLRGGDGPAPEGFDARSARDMRKGGSRRGAKVLRLADLGPRWVDAGISGNASDAEKADGLQKRMMTDFQDYARLVGAERVSAFLDVMIRLGVLAGASVKEGVPVREGVKERGKESERNSDKRSS
jgi:hypothetical protein